MHAYVNKIKKLLIFAFHHCPIKKHFSKRMVAWNLFWKIEATWIQDIKWWTNILSDLYRNFIL